MTSLTAPRTTAPRSAHRLTLRDRVRSQFERRAARQKLVRDLSRYRTPRERAELEAMFERGRPEQVAQLRRIVQAQDRLIA